jgi:predicted component of type VI protein secretion system
MIDVLHFHSGEGRYALHAVVASCGADVVVIVGGGEGPHVGAVALAISHPSLKDPSKPSQTASLLTVPGHKEGELARAASMQLARAIHRTVVVSVGIHVEDASKDEINQLVEAFNALIDEIEEQLTARQRETGGQNGAS